MNQDADTPREGRFAVVDRCIHFMARWSDRLAAFICASLIVTTTASMALYQLGIVFPWLDDVLRMLLIWLVYLGAVSLCLRNEHISMDAFNMMMPQSVRKVVAVLTALLAIGLCSFIAKIGYDSMMITMQFGQLLPSGYIPAWPQSLAIPLGFGLMTIAYLSYLWFLLSGRMWAPPSEVEKYVEKHTGEK